MERKPSRSYATPPTGAGLHGDMTERTKPFMQRRWLNNKEPDENGDYILVIENSKGGRISTFKGKTLEEVAEKLADSQMSANEEIIRLRKPDAARPKQKIEPKPLSPADRLRLSSEITDPERVVEAVEEIVTARQGISPDSLGARLSKMDQDQQDEFYAAEAKAFRDEHPEFYPVPQNRDALFAELRANGWDLTRNNLAIAFQTLLDRDEMILWPSDNGENEASNNQPHLVEPQVKPNGQATAQPPSPRPRSVSTGIRASDASALPPTPIKKTAKYTRADIEKMSRSEFAEKLRNEPGFRQQVDAMSA